jgi:PAS domain S-box-containing protein
MTWNVLQAWVLFASAAVAIWVGVTAFERQSLPGRSWLGWLQLSIAVWCLTSGIHALLVSTDQRILSSQIQYIGIMAIPVCWLEFAREYTRRPARAQPWLMWIIPAITVAMAFSNDAHHLLWSAIRPAPILGGTTLIYDHGPWFAVAIAFTYVALGTGTVWLWISVRSQPEQYRRQNRMLMLALLTPWLGNLIYVSGLSPLPGLDFTPLGFAASGVFFSIGLFRYKLLDLVPIARAVLFDSLGDAAFVIDKEGRIVDHNAAARGIAGDVAIGQPIEKVVRWWKQRPRPGSSSEVVHVDGRALEIQMRPVLDDQRELSAWLVIARDVTERERAEAERRALDHRLMEQAQVESLSLLAGGLAHDFNSLLTGILGNADLANHQLPADSPARTSVGAILVAAERAAELVARMRDYAGDRRQGDQPADLADITADMVHLMRSSAARHTSVLFDRPAGPARTVGDVTQLRQILLNLISNAAEATAAGGTITVRVSTETGATSQLSTATFDATRPETGSEPATFVVIDVSDNGAGMDAVTAARVFDPFFSTKAAGRGLGLSAVLGIVRSHHGAIRVQSELGKGTGIRVWIPAIAGADKVG